MRRPASAPRRRRTARPTSPPWPSLDEIKAAWTEAGDALGLLGFLVQHDSYHPGQLSLLRKTCGLPAMSYS